jgi:DNA-binding NarL/FixJ family response regulator
MNDFKEKNLRVAIIEDSKTTMNLLQMLIQKTPNMEVCGAWPCAEDALPQIHETEPNVVIVDLELPGMNGQDCIQILSAMLPSAALVVLTVHDDPERVFGSLKAGANGYLLKTANLEGIIEGIITAHRGESPLSPAIAGMIIRTFQKKNP